MASTHSLYKKFNESIKLSESKKNELRTSREAIRSDIRDWLTNKGKGKSSFKIQGSFAMHTVVNPIDGDEFDIDDGLYLDGYEDSNKSTWPGCETAHNWVVSAVSDRTNTPPINKDACVRVTYGHGYHVDVPIYIKLDGRSYLASKSRGWTESDAIGLVEWLDGKNNGDGQLKRMIRYLKRWKDYRSVPLKGVELTILAVNNFTPADGRDDDAMRYTVEKIISSLDGAFECRKPVASWEDLFEGMSDSKKKIIRDELAYFLSELKEASNATGEKEASDHLQNVFGSDFPKGNPSDGASAYVKTSTAAVLKHDGRSG